MARGEPSFERAIFVLGSGVPRFKTSLGLACGALSGSTIFSLATRGNDMVYKNNIKNGGDAARHSSRRVSHGGEKRTMESRFATLNVRGGMDNKIDEVCQMMNERKIDLLCVNETKRKGCDTSKYGPFTAYWSGVPTTARGSQGVGLILSERMAKCVNGFECVSSRLIWVRLKVGLTRIFVLGVYAPTDVGTSSSNSAQKERLEFWECMSAVLRMRETNERLVLLGDFNGWVGVKRDGYERILGPFGDERVNNNGKSLLAVCLEMNLCVTNTMFAHKKIHMYTWEKTEARSMIDFIIVDERLKKNVLDTRSFRGTGVDTDHFLVMCRIKGLFRGWRHRIPDQSSVLERIKVERLQGDVQTKYEKTLQLKFDGLKEVCEIEDVWNIVKNEIVNVAADLCGMSKRRKCVKKKNVWWDKDVQEAVSEKKKAWKDWLASRADQRANNTNEESVHETKAEYKRMNGVVKDLVRKKKDEEKDEFDERMCKDFRSNIKFFWKSVKSIRGKTVSTKLESVRDKNGNIINGEECILKRWKEYFEGLFEKEEMSVSSRMDVREENGDRISVEEVVNALKRMKKGKAAGYDKVTVEMLKAGQGIVASILCHLFNLCWNSGVVPKDWRNAVIVPLYKGKGSQQDCQSYRGISLLSVVGKLYAKILIERVMKETNGKIWDVQAGFRKGMGCTDQVFSLRSVAEKSLAKGHKVFCAFVDLEKAYDRVIRSELWAALSRFGVNSSLIQALKSLYEDSSACVRINGAYTDWFHINKGVRQGCVASPWLFNLFMDECLKDLRDSVYGIKMNGLSLKCLLYADDQVILASSEEELQKMVTIMNNSLKRKGMKINASKTKVMVFERSEGMTGCAIDIDNERVEQVKEFVYLGSVFTRDGKHDSDIERRVAAGNRVNGALHTFMSSQKVSKKARQAVHGGVLVPTLMYGSESWVWQKKHVSKIRAVEMRALRGMCGVTLRDRIRNIEVMERCGVKEDVVTRIEKGMLRWFGHLERMDEGRLTKQVHKENVEGRVGRGRPHRGYIDQIDDILGKGNVRSTLNRRACMKRVMKADEAKVVCQDRAKWRSIVSAYPYGIQA